MDRPLDAEHLRRQALTRRTAAGSALCVGAAALLFGPALLRPSVARAQVRIAIADRGPVDSVITASGTVVPEVEQAVSSPVDARVLRILKRPGAHVAQGEAILELDQGASVLALDTLEQQIALKGNQQDRARLALQATLDQVRGRLEIKRLQLASLRSQLQRTRALFASGLVSEEARTQAELAEAQASIELQQIESERKHAEAAARAEVSGLALEMATVRRQRDEARRQVELGTTRATRDGVLTWTVAEEGVLVRRGDVIARVADLGGFKVDATFSDIHARRLRVGQAATVRVGEDVLTATVGHVDPAVHDGVMSASLSLDERASPLLRPNLRVDVFVATERHADAVRLPRGPGLPGTGSGDVFVVRGDRALRTRVQVGMIGSDRCELLDGVAPGDAVIVSDTTSFDNAKEIRIR
jgi:HlyD family secretion protein